MWVRRMKRRDIRTIARRRKRAAPGGGMRRGSFPRPDFRSPSSHRASGIVRHEGDQMPSRQLFGSRRFDRDHLTASGARGAAGDTVLTAQCMRRSGRGNLDRPLGRDIPGSQAEGKLPPYFGPSYRKLESSESAQSESTSEWGFDRPGFQEPDTEAPQPLRLRLGCYLTIASYCQ